jgi:hypothetical protein
MGTHPESSRRGCRPGAGGPDRLLGVVTAAHLLDQLLQT